MTAARPFWVTIFAILLAWLSLGGVALAAWASIIDVRPGARAAFSILGVWYALSALASAVGLWGLRSWAVPALGSWAVATVVAAVLPHLVIGKFEFSVGYLVGVIALMCLVVVPLWYVGCRAVRRGADVSVSVQPN